MDIEYYTKSVIFVNFLTDFKHFSVDNCCLNEFVS